VPKGRESAGLTEAPPAEDGQHLLGQYTSEDEHAVGGVSERSRKSELSVTDVLILDSGFWILNSEL
jgi:hypothetical protein